MLYGKKTIDNNTKFIPNIQNVCVVNCMQRENGFILITNVNFKYSKIHEVNICEVSCAERW